MDENNLTIEELETKLEEIEKQIETAKQPLLDLQSEMARYRGHISELDILHRDDSIRYMSKGGAEFRQKFINLIHDGEAKLASMREQVQNQLKPLQSLYESTYSLLQRKEKEQEEREEKQRMARPINLDRWITRWHKPNIYQLVGMAHKRENQILSEICSIYSLKLIQRKDLSNHYAKKYKQFRLTKCKRGLYLISSKEKIFNKKTSDFTSGLSDEKEKEIQTSN